MNSVGFSPLIVYVSTFLQNTSSVKLFFFHRKGFSLNFVFSLVCVDIILGEFYAVELLSCPVTSA